MKDKWMNIGYEGEELQPYHEPEADLNDDIRIRKHYTTINHLEKGCIVILFKSKAEVTPTLLTISTYYGMMLPSKCNYCGMLGGCMGCVHVHYSTSKQESMTRQLGISTPQP